jgi:hypothetical protein
MNVQNLLEKIGKVNADPKVRAEFFESLVSKLSAEAEISYPGRLRPGPEYDQAIRNLSTIVKAKGKIHAFYNLNCRWVVPGKNVDDQSGVGEQRFFRDLFAELEQSPDIENRVFEIIESNLKRF